jgi:SanA protein
MIERLKQLRWKLVWACLAILLSTALINLWITQSAKPRVFHSLGDLPANDVGLVLGASPRAGGGFTNPHFQNRLEAAAKLYHGNKVKHLLLSGDNHIAGYDEPTEMRDALLNLGVPSTAMTLDYAGFRTLDSVVRAKAVFGQTRLTIITDNFHAQRALFLCQNYGIDAVAFCSKPVPLKYSGATQMREWMARVKAFLDVYALRTEPRFYGPKVEIIIEPTHS